MPTTGVAMRRLIAVSAAAGIKTLTSGYYNKPVTITAP
jgi:hypothetical protein